jgi:hypothetical protein
VIFEASADLSRGFGADVLRDFDQVCWKGGRREGGKGGRKGRVEIISRAGRTFLFHARASRKGKRGYSLSLPFFEVSTYLCFRKAAAPPEGGLPPPNSNMTPTCHVAALYVCTRGGREEGRERGRESRLRRKNLYGLNPLERRERDQNIGCENKGRHEEKE